VKKNILLFFIFFIFLLNSSLFANDKIKKDDFPGEYSSKNLLLFTRSLIARGNYYRALTELNRLKSFYPNFLPSYKFNMTKLYLLLKGEQYKSVIDFKYKRDNSQKNNTAITIFKIDAYLRLGDFTSLTSLMKKKIGLPDYREELLKRKLFISILTYSSSDMKKIIEYKKNIKFKKYMSIIDYSIKEIALYRNLTVAAWIGIIPGMGYVYAGNYKTGLVALAIVAINVAIAVTGFMFNNKPLGSVAAVVGGFFYGGSIFGGYYEAKRYNERIRKNLSEHLFNDFNLSEDEDKIYNRFGLANE